MKTKEHKKEEHQTQENIMGKNSNVLNTEMVEKGNIELLEKQPKEEPKVEQPIVIEEVALQIHPTRVDLFTTLFIDGNRTLRGMEINRGVVLDNGTSMIFIPNCIIDKEKLTIKGTL